MSGPTGTAAEVVNVAGAVLCGGASRRMGTDKALIEIDGVMMAERVARVLDAAGCRPVIFVGGHGDALGATGRAVHPDQWPGSGPVGGVISAIRAIRSAAPGADRVVVTACDLVDLTPGAVRRVIDADATPGADVRVADSGRLEPMLTCWSTSVVSDVEALFSVGARALHDVLASLSARRVPVEPAALRNANRPDDLADRLTRPPRPGGPNSLA